MFLLLLMILHVQSYGHMSLLEIYGQKSCPVKLKKESLLAKTFRIVILREMKNRINQDELHRVGNRYPTHPY